VGARGGEQVGEPAHVGRVEGAEPAVELVVDGGRGGGEGPPSRVGGGDHRRAAVGGVGAAGAQAAALQPVDQLAGRADGDAQGPGHVLDAGGRRRGRGAQRLEAAQRQALGAVPEMLQTAHGALTVGLDARPGQTLLVRGGTSAVGLATAVLATRLGMTVLATTRDLARADVLERAGVDHPVLDDGAVAERVRALVPGGVDAALELVGTPTLPDTLAAVRVHGVVCFAGMLSNRWTVPDFYPIGYLPRGVRLSAYSGDAADLPAAVLQGFLDDVAAGRAAVPIARTFDLDGIVEAHALMEHGSAGGKLVVVP
jgi:NADPH:quinone reductase-like Zn-dependent oxidoreductase